MPHRQGEVHNLHNAFGHPNNQAFLQHCQHAKIGTKYLFKTTVLSTGGVLMNSSLLLRVRGVRGRILQQRRLQNGVDENWIVKV